MYVLVCSRNTDKHVHEITGRFCDIVWLIYATISAVQFQKRTRVDQQNTLVVFDALNAFVFVFFPTIAIVIIHHPSTMIISVRKCTKSFYLTLQSFLCVVCCLAGSGQQVSVHLGDEYQRKITVPSHNPSWIVYAITGECRVLCRAASPTIVSLFIRIASHFTAVRLDRQNTARPGSHNGLLPLQFKQIHH